MYAKAIHFRSVIPRLYRWKEPSCTMQVWLGAETVLAVLGFNFTVQPGNCLRLPGNFFDGKGSFRNAPKKSPVPPESRHPCAGSRHESPTSCLAHAGNGLNGVGNRTEEPAACPEGAANCRHGSANLPDRLGEGKGFKFNSK